MGHTEVTNFEHQKQIHASPSEGVYIEGLHMDGAAWCKGDKENPGMIAESVPKKLFSTLPILLVTARSKALEAKMRKDLFGAAGPYECPCYKYSCRTDRYFVFCVDLRT